jgi:hypothetical protein
MAPQLLELGLQTEGFLFARLELQFEAARLFLAPLKLHPHKPVDVSVTAWRK